MNEPVELLKYSRRLEVPPKIEKLNGRYSTNNTTHQENKSFCIVWNKVRFEVERSRYDYIVHNCLRVKKSLSSKRTENATSVGNFELSSAKRLIFNNVNGSANSGEILAILGPSGAGKTSLLNALIGCGSNGYSGNWCLTGMKKSITMSYIQQNDYLNEYMTVKECLILSSRLKNLHSDFNHQDNVNRIVKVLNLTNCLNTRCANLSGGEYKRTAVGSELVSRPDLLILDEPTSGLDYYNAKKMLTCLRQMTRDSLNPMSVVLTIHQPSCEIFNLFDRVYIMARLGQVVYEGSPKKVLVFLKSITKDIPDTIYDSYANKPASLVLDIASGVHGQETVDLLSQYQIAEHCSKFCLLSSSILSEADSSSSNNKLKIANEQQRHHYWYKVGLLLDCELRTSIRNNMQVLTSVVTYLVSVVLIWLILPSDTSKLSNFCPLILKDLTLAGLFDDSEAGLTELSYNRRKEYFNLIDKLRALIMTIIIFSIVSAAVSLYTFPEKMRVSMRDIRNGCYSYSAFLVSIFFRLIIYDTLLPILTFVILYRLLGLPHSFLEWRMWAMSLLVGFTTLITATMGMFFGAMFINSLPSAIVITIAALLPQLISSGLLLRPSNMLPWIRNISWASMYRSSFSLLVLIKEGFNICQCNDELEKYLSQVNPSFVDIPVPIQHTLGHLLTVDSSKILPVDEVQVSGKIVVEDFSFEILAKTLAGSLDVGRFNYRSCSQYRPIFVGYYAIHDYQALYALFGLTMHFVIFSLLLTKTIKYQLGRTLQV